MRARNEWMVKGQALGRRGTHTRRGSGKAVKGQCKIKGKALKRSVDGKERQTMVHKAFKCQCKVNKWP